MLKKIVQIFVFCILLSFIVIPGVISIDSNILVHFYSDFSDNNHSYKIRPMNGDEVFLDGWLEKGKLFPTDGGDYNSFGCSMSLYNHTALVGARNDDYGFNSGVAYIFQYENGVWVQEAKLLASDGVEGDWFGWSVSLHDDIALIGAFEDDDNGDSSGSAYIFEKIDGSWVQVSKLLPNDGTEDDWFGYAVSIFNQTAVVAARGKDFQHDFGAVYIFQQTNGSWLQQAKLMPSDSSPGDCFGESLSLENETLIIGSTAYGTSGSAYVFQNNNGTWIQQMKLLPSDGAFGDGFGFSVSLSGNNVVIGALADDDYGELSGSAYIFQQVDDIWIEQKKLLASDGSGGDNFGFSVSMSGESILIGARQDSDNLGGTGSAYMFKKIGEEWIEEAKLWAADGTGLYFFFGGSVSIWSNLALITAEGDENNGDSSGSIYVFENVGLNQAPNTPEITGPSTGRTRTDYTYYVNTSDPDGDPQYISWDWGDGYTSGWLGSFDNEVKAQNMYWWLDKGTYMITVTFRDQYGAMTKGFLEVTMPKSVIFPFDHQIIKELFERFPYIFPILRHLLRY